MYQGVGFGFRHIEKDERPVGINGKELWVRVGRCCSILLLLRTGELENRCVLGIGLFDVIKTCHAGLCRLVQIDRLGDVEGRDAHVCMARHIDRKVLATVGVATMTPSLTTPSKCHRSTT